MADNVRAVIYNSKGEFLLVMESDDIGQWKLPGGKLDSEESPEAGIKRELQEELGFTPSGKLQFKELVTDDGLSKRFIFSVPASETDIRPSSDEIYQLGWFSLETIPNCKNTNHIKVAVESLDV